MKQVLVPTDFSKCADNAVDFAVQSAKILPAEVTLLHSFEVVDNTYTDYMGVNREFNLSIISDAKKKLEEIKKNTKENNAMDIDTSVSTDSIQDSIMKFTKEKQIDLIVMGTQGASGLKEIIGGSRTATTIGKTKIPIIAVPIDYTWKKPQKMLFMTNKFEREASILNPIFELADLYMAEMQVAVFTDEDDDRSGTFVEHRDRISEYEQLLKNSYKEETIASTHLIGENFEEALQEFIKENSIDILVMVTYQRKFWDRIFNPSKTKKMSYHTHIPLLAIPARENGSKSI